MAKWIKTILLIMLPIFGIFFSCSIEKRLYRPGYYVVNNSIKDRQIKCKSKPEFTRRNKRAHLINKPFDIGNAVGEKNNNSADPKTISRKMHVPHQSIKEKMPQRSSHCLSNKIIPEKIMHKIAPVDSEAKVSLIIGLFFILVGLVLFVSAKSFMSVQSVVMSSFLTFIFILSLLILLIGVIICIVALK